jgi:hypothetical protein
MTKNIAEGESGIFFAPASIAKGTVSPTLALRR